MADPDGSAARAKSLRPPVCTGDGSRQAPASAVPPPRARYPQRSRPAIGRYALVIDGWLLTDHGALCKRPASRCRDRHPHTLADTEIAR